MDKRAHDILVSVYWGTKGWKAETERTVDQADLAYAKSKGVMYDPVSLNHDGVVKKAVTIRDQIEPRAVANAFVHSLGTRVLAYRSALGSYATLKNFPTHQWVGEKKSCALCGCYNRTESREKDLNVLNFERIKWGGVRHMDPLYAAFDLEQFQKLEVAPPSPEQIQLLRDLLQSIEATPSGTSAAKLQTKLPKALKSNKAERDMLVGILGICGVLETPDHRGFLISFIAESEREYPARHYIDMTYPACWWTANIGINWDAVRFWFGHLL